jgi:hypothetical protein
VTRAWRAASLLANNGVLVAAVEVQRVDVDEQTDLGDVEGGFEHAHVVAVRTVDRPGDRDTVALDRDRPLPP